MENDKLKTRIDFVAIVSVDGANPNGDPENDNLPRTDQMGYGEISDVCIKHKLRRRMAAAHIEGAGEPRDEVLMVGKEDGFYEGRSISSRLAEKENGALLSILSNGEKKGRKGKTVDDAEPITGADRLKKQQVLCENYIDARLFGQVLAIPAGQGLISSISLNVRGALTVQTAKSVAPIEISTKGITTSLPARDSEKRSSDQMGKKHTVDRAAYVIKGSINGYIAEKNGVTKSDAEAVKQALLTLFVNDESSSRPAGTMEVKQLFWFLHKDKAGKYPVNRVFNSVKVHPSTEYPYFHVEFDEGDVPGLTPEIFYL